jgi:protein involved in polysaccharide export with SLBB domain
MTSVHYTAEVKSDLLLELPAEAQALHLKPGDKIQVQFDASPEPEEAKPVIDAKTATAIAFLDARIAEGITADPDTRRQAEEELEEFKHNMSPNRAAPGDHPFYI